MRSYVVGFLFSEDRARVALIRKTHPEWQAGKLNGIGGKIEGEENPYLAMAREFEEESGGIIGPFRWEVFATITGNDGKYKGSTGCESQEPFIVFFLAASDSYILGKIGGYTSTNGERVEVHCVGDTFKMHDVLPCIKWIIPMAIVHYLSPVEVYRINEDY